MVVEEAQTLEEGELRRLQRVSSSGRPPVVSAFLFLPSIFPTAFVYALPLTEDLAAF